MDKKKIGDAYVCNMIVVYLNFVYEVYSVFFFVDGKKIIENELCGKSLVLFWWMTSNNNDGGGGDGSKKCIRCLNEAKVSKYELVLDRHRDTNIEQHPCHTWMRAWKLKVLIKSVRCVSFIIIIVITVVVVAVYVKLMHILLYELINFQWPGFFFFCFPLVSPS